MIREDEDPPVAVLRIACLSMAPNSSTSLVHGRCVTELLDFV
jgi:hypothetical protein